MKLGISALGTPALAFVIILAQTVPSRQNPTDVAPNCTKRIDKTIDNIISCLNDTIDDQTNYTITICVSGLGNSPIPTSTPSADPHCTENRIPLNCSGILMNFTIEYCLCTTPVNTTFISLPTTSSSSSKAETMTTTESQTSSSPPSSHVNAQNIKKKIEHEISKLMKSNKENRARIIIVKNFKGPEVGSAKEPVYASTTSDTKVEKIVLQNASENARAVIVNQVVETNNSRVNEQHSDTDSAKSVTEVFSDRYLSISAFDGEEELEVKKVTFTIDISNGKMKYVSEQIASSDQPFTRQIVQSMTPSCSFINGSNFSTKGCEQVEYEPGKKLSCLCNHATVFAVLMSANVVIIPSGVKIVSYITEAFSILFLILTVALLGKVRNRVRGDRVKVQICVAASVLVLHILNVLHDAALQNDVTCAILTVLIHYFLLCSAMWMLMEGITLLFKTLDSVMRMLSGENAKKFAATRYALSFGVPFVIVLISASYGFSQNNYVAKNKAHIENDTSSLKYEFCSIGNLDIRIGAVIIPIALILTTCFGVVIRMFYVVYKMSSESENYKPTQLRRESSVTEQFDLQHVQAALKATLVLLPVLGVPWFLGFFTSIENGHAAQIVFMYLNAIVNGLQGVFLFFVYCVIGKEVRHAILKSYARKKYSLASSFEFISKRRGTTTMEGSIGTSLPVTATTNLGDNYTVTDNQSHKSVESEKSDAKENAETIESKA